MVAGALTSWIFPAGFLQNNNGIAKQSRSALTLQSIQLIQASQGIVSTKDNSCSKRSTPLEVPIPVIDLTYTELIQLMEDLN